MGLAPRIRAVRSRRRTPAGLAGSGCRSGAMPGSRRRRPWPRAARRPARRRSPRPPGRATCREGTIRPRKSTRTGSRAWSTARSKVASVTVRTCWSVIIRLPPCPAPRRLPGGAAQGPTRSRSDCSLDPRVQLGQLAPVDVDTTGVTPAGSGCRRAGSPGTADLLEIEPVDEQRADLGDEPQVVLVVVAVAVRAAAGHHQALLLVVPIERRWRPTAWRVPRCASCPPPAGHRRARHQCEGQGRYGGRPDVAPTPGNRLSLTMLLAPARARVGGCRGPRV